MLKVRPPFCTGTSAAVCGAAAVADAGAGVILLAICAMKVPRPAMTAAMITMLRMTPHQIRTVIKIDFITEATTPGLRRRRQSLHFREKDERNVNVTRVTFPAAW